MYWLTRVFDKVFVRRFYEAHLLAFLFIVLVMFGMADCHLVLYMHYYILQNAFSSWFPLFCLWFVWALYSANGLRYMLNTLGKDEFRFLYTSNSAPAFNLSGALAFAVVQINAPVIIYGLIGVVIGVMHGHFVFAIAGALGLIMNVLVTVAIIYNRLVSAYKLPLIGELKLLPRISVRPNMFSVLLRYITHDNKVALIATKVFSCSVLYGAHYEWSSFNYDIRWMQVAMAISIPAQGVLLFQVWSFETTYLSFTRNFPIAIWKRYLYILALVMVLLIPEAALLTAYCVRFHLLWQLPVYVLYAVALPMLLCAMLFTRGFNQDSFMSFLFAIGLATFFVTLFGFTWLLGLAFLPISYLVYRDAFYEWE